jgi:hypothetical protein
MPDRPDRHRQRRVRIPAAIVGGLLLALTLVLPALAAMGPTKLETASVGPRAGTTETTISFQVTYRSVRGLEPAYVRVRVGATTYGMTGNGTDWRAGVVFTFATRLPIGTYDVLFEAKDAEKFVDELGAGTVEIAAPPPPPTPSPTHRPEEPAPTAPPSPAITPAPSEPPGDEADPYVIRPHDPEFDPGYPEGTTGSAGAGSTGTSDTARGDAWWSEDGTSGGGTDRGGTDRGGSDGRDDAIGAGTTTGGTGSGSGPNGDSNGAGTGGPGTGDHRGGSGAPGGDPSDATFSTPALAALARHDPFGRPNAWLGAPLASALESLGVDAGRPTFVVGLVGSTAGVAVWMAFALFGKRRRDEQPPASDDILSAVARQSAPIAPVAAMVPPTDPELLMPRWRRPSLLEARKTDPTRTPAAARPRLTFGAQPVSAMSGAAPGTTYERRLIRYAVAPILDRPDELYGNRLGDLTTGDEVQLIERSGAYWMVLCPDGQQGWLHRMTLGDTVATRSGAFEVEPGDGQLDGQDALKALLAARGLS